MSYAAWSREVEGPRRHSRNLVRIVVESPYRVLNKIFS